MKTYKLIYILVVLIAVGAGSYFIGFNQGREKEILAKREEIKSLQEKINGSQVKSSSSTEAQAQSPAEGSQTNKTPETRSIDEEFDEYVVQDKDTLFTIGLKFDLTWEKIAAANNLEENARLYIGQKLKIPKAGSEAANTGVTPITINQEEATNQQKAANEQGTDLWRRDPIEVVRQEAPASFHLLPGDPYALLNKDTTVGKATVFLQKESKSYTFSLVQPVDKGDNGIWKIENIETKDN